MYVDRDIDAVMERTQQPAARHRRASTPRSGPRLRHRPRGRRLRRGCGRLVNLLSAVLAVGGLPLLRVRLHAVAEAHVRASNIVIGGAAGAVPVLIGWSAVTNCARLGARSCCSPSSSSGRRRTSGPWPSGTATTTPRPTCRCCRPWPACARRPRASSSTRCCCGRSPCSSPPWPAWAPSTSAPPLVLGAVFTSTPSRLLRDRTPQPAMRLFTWSITYITLLFGAMAADQLIRSGCVDAADLRFSWPHRPCD